MEEERVQDSMMEEEKYEPRPMRQVWAARIGLIFFLMIVAYQILSIARGGL